MGRTFIRQDVQILPSLTYDDTVTVGSTMESAPTSIEGDLNSLRSQLKRWLWADSAGNWYDDIPTINSKKRGINDLATTLDSVEEHKFLFRTQVITDVTVPHAQNWVVLNVAASEAPTLAAAVDAGTAQGAVVATLGTDELGTHKLTAISGPNAISPKNLVLIRDGNGETLYSDNNKMVYGLIQTEYGVVDGDVFDDTDHQVQISFVRENATATALEAVPVADIQDKVINYSYAQRLAYDSLPETAFMSGVWLDQTASALDIALDKAVDNQVGAVTQSNNIDWRITDTNTWKLQTSDGLRDLLAISPTSGGDTLQVNIDTFDINNGNDADFLNGAIFDSGGTSINVGVTAAQIDAAASLTLAATGGSSNLTLSAGLEMLFVDGNKAGSTYAGDLKLSETSQEWSDFESRYGGEISIIKAIMMGRMRKAVAVTTGPIDANGNVTGAGGGANLDAQLLDYSTVDFVTQVNVYLNGALLRNGADATANHDVYPGDTATTGDLKFEFALAGTDVVTMEIYG
jgi:hypothetical protein